jgi:hypothetical protein
LLSHRRKKDAFRDSHVDGWVHGLDNESCFLQWANDFKFCKRHSPFVHCNTPIVYKLICPRVLICNAPVAQWTRRLTTDQEIESSILSGGMALQECAFVLLLRKTLTSALVAVGECGWRHWPGLGTLLDPVAALQHLSRSTRCPRSRWRRRRCSDTATTQHAGVAAPSDGHWIYCVRRPSTRRALRGRGALHARPGRDARRRGRRIRRGRHGPRRVRSRGRVG